MRPSRSFWESALPCSDGLTSIGDDPSAIAGDLPQRVVLMARKPAPMPILPDADYWRKRAESARASAEGASDSDGRACMLAIAETYERIAQTAARLKEPRG
jgi:hypothetical protein